MTFRTITFAGLLSSILTSMSLYAEEVPAVSFRGQIAPLLNDNCLACHCSKRAEGGYRVDTINKLFTAGDSSEQPIAPASESLGEVFQRLVSDDPDVRMPAEHPAFTTEQISLVKNWISQGAIIDVEDKDAQLWSIIPPQTYAAPPEKYPQSIPITAIRFSEDGNLLQVSGYHEILNWRIGDKTLASRFPNQPQRILDVVELSNSKRLLTAGGKPGKLGEVRCNLADNGSLEKVLTRSSEMILGITSRPNSTEIAIAGGDSTIKLVDYVSGELKQTFYSHADWVTDIAFNGDGTKMASSSQDKSCKVYDLTNGEVTANYTKHNAAVRGIACTSLVAAESNVIGDGAEWISIGANNQLHQWKVDGTATVFSVPLSGEPLKFITTSNFAFVIQANKQWSQISISEKKVVKSFPLNTTPQSIAIHEQTNRIAIGGLDGTVSVWDLGEGKTIDEFAAFPR